ncbi:MAG: hypothetical protein NTW49_02580 [Bacteroidia bacterium]|nr:hypothetical protein [Bacteroidia bacterium]
MKNSKKIDDLLRENTAVFDDDEPPEGHIKRFEDKLKARQAGHLRKFNAFYFLKIAAIVILVVISSLWVIEKTSTRQEKAGIALKDVSTDYAEVEVYYTSEINEKLTELGNVKSGGEMIRNDLMKKEFSEMDSLYRSLEVELKSKPGNERIIDAMISYYRTKLEILNKILLQLNNVKQLNNQGNEKPKAVSGNNPVYHINSNSPGIIV